MGNALADMINPSDSKCINMDKITKHLKDKLEIIPIPCLKYINNKWEALPHNQGTMNTLQNKTMSFICYNVCSEEHNWDNRLKAILEIIHNYNSDVICLQEVTDEFIEFLKKDQFIQENYSISSNYEGAYDVLILTKFNVKFYKRNFDSNQNRNLLIAEIALNSSDAEERIVVGTAHYESLDLSIRHRKEQLIETFEILDFFPIAFLMGDFNFAIPKMEEEEETINKHFEDAWVTFKASNNLPEEEGFTTPEMKKKMMRKNTPSRQDRILFKNSCNKNESKILKLEKFEVLGKNTIEQNPDQLLEETFLNPSDHFGLFAVFHFNK